MYKTRAKNKAKTNGDKKPNKKRRKDNKTLSQKSEKGQVKRGSEKNLTKDNKRKEPKIKILAHELLASTLSYLILALW
jgi:hypothetical protein